MNRRRLLQAFAAATFAAVVEVTGAVPKLPSIKDVKSDSVRTIISLWEETDVVVFGHSIDRQGYSGSTTSA
jgi:hypothetical protein